MTPESTDSVLHQAATHQQAGRLAEAEGLYRQLLAAAPAHPDANHNLAVLILQSGRSMEAALPHFERAYAADPSQLQYWLSYVRALVHAGQLDSARRVHADGTLRGLRGPDPDLIQSRLQAGPAAPSPRSIATDPALATALAELGTLQRQGAMAAVEARARALVAHYPDHPAPAKALGLALRALGQPQEALGFLERAARGASQDADAWLQLGQVLLDLSLYAEADQAFRRALAGRLPAAFTGLAQAMLGQHRHADAARLCRQAIGAGFDSSALQLALGEALLGLRQLPEATACVQRALELQPGDPLIYRKLGSLLFEQGLDQEMLALAQRRLAQAPQDAAAHADLGKIWMRMGRLEEARAAFQQSLRLAPQDLDTRSAWLYCCNFLSSLGPEDLLREARLYGQYATAAARPYQHWLRHGRPGVLRVGLISGDLREHPVGYFLESVLAASDRKRVEWLAYPTVAASDATQARLQSLMSDWTVLAGLSPEQCAARIHADGLDLLIDLAGHTAHNALPVLAWRPAPIQLSWLGYFATTGLEQMDVFLADAISVPAEHRRHYSERVEYLPDTRLCFTPPADAPAVASLPAETAPLTFGSFQPLRKINAAVLEAWAAILRRCPEARLRIQNADLDTPALRDHLQAQAAASGIDPARLSLHGAASRRQYLAQHGEVDLILDTFPFPGGTTTCEALWMGVPTLTLAGQTLVARQGASLLHAAGLADWIAHSPEEYVALAVAKAQQPAALAELRAALRARLPATPLFDAERFAERLLDALWRIAGTRAST